MSKIFYDHVLDLKKVDKEIRKVAKTPEEREELWALVDEMIHHKVMGCILDNLPRAHHEEFLELFHKSPHDEGLLFGYLKSKVGDNFEELIRQEIMGFSSELLEVLKEPRT